MRNAWILLMAAVVCGAMIGCVDVATPAEGPGGPAAGAQGGDPNAIGMQLYWDHRLSLGSGETVTRIYQLDEMLYCMTNRNRLFARDAATGLDRWTVTVAQPGAPVFRPTHVDKIKLSATVPGAAALVYGEPNLDAYDAVVLNTSSQLIVINRRDGNILRRMDLPVPTSSGGATDRMAMATFYGGSADGSYYAYSIQRGVRQWIKSTPDMILAPVECGNGRVFIASTTGTFLSVATNSDVMWQKKLGGAVTAPFLVDKRAIFVGCEDSRVYALPMEARTSDDSNVSGGIKWERPFVCQGPVRSAVQASENTVFAKSDGDKFYAINLVNGQQRWTLPKGVLVGAVIGSDAYVQSDGQLLVVDEMLGKGKGSMSLGTLTLVCPSTNGKAVWAASTQGRVVCLRPGSVPALKAQDIRDAVK